MNQRDQKIHNQRGVLDLLRAKPGISQSSLAELLLLQPSTVSNLVRGFKELGMIKIVGKGGSGLAGGKKADQLSLDSAYGSFGGFFVKNDELVICVLDFEEKLVVKNVVPILNLAAKALTKLIVATIVKQEKQYPNYRGAGIAVSSVVTNEREIVASAHFDRALPGIIEALAQKLPSLSVVIENDANCCVYFDQVHYRDKHANVLHLLHRSKPFTVGAGLVLDGRLYRGGGGGAGEIVDSMIGKERDPVRVLESIIRFLAKFLDIDAVYVSSDSLGRFGELIDNMSAELELPILAGGDNSIAVNGASMLAMELHMEQLLHNDKSRLQEEPG